MEIAIGESKAEEAAQSMTPGANGGTFVPYNNGFKARMIERMTGPAPTSANALSKEVGVSQGTLSRWLKERTLEPMENNEQPKRRTWAAAEKLRIVHESLNLDEKELGELLRRVGIHDALLQEWRDAANEGAMSELGPQKRKRAGKSPEELRIKLLEKELNRKDKALAEVTALLTLKKRYEEIWGDEDDDTTGRNAK